MSDKLPTPEEKAQAEAAGLTVQPEPVQNEGQSLHDIVAERLRNLDWGELPSEVRRSMATPVSLSAQMQMMLSIFVDLCGGKTQAIKHMEARKAFGLAKYNTVLQAHNGRDALADAKDELGDVLVYYAQAIAEERTLWEHHQHRPLGT